MSTLSLISTAYFGLLASSCVLKYWPHAPMPLRSMMCFPDYNRFFFFFAMFRNDGEAQVTFAEVNSSSIQNKPRWFSVPNQLFKTKVFTDNRVVDGGGAIIYGSYTQSIWEDKTVHVKKQSPTHSCVCQGSTGLNHFSRLQGFKISRDTF